MYRSNSSGREYTITVRTIDTIVVEGFDTRLESIEATPVPSSLQNLVGLVADFGLRLFDPSRLLSHTVHEFIP